MKLILNCPRAHAITYTNDTACRTHFHMRGFALRLFLKQRQRRTRKWPISQSNGSIGRPLGFVIDRLNTSTALYRITPCLRVSKVSEWILLVTLEFWSSFIVANISEHFLPQPSVWQKRPDDNTGNFMLYSWVLLRPLLTITSTGPTVYSPYPRRPERLTIWRYNYNQLF